MFFRGASLGTDQRIANWFDNLLPSGSDGALCLIKRKVSELGVEPKPSLDTRSQEGLGSNRWRVTALQQISRHITNPPYQRGNRSLKKSVLICPPLFTRAESTIMILWAKGVLLNKAHRTQFLRTWAIRCDAKVNIRQELPCSRAGVSEPKNRWMKYRLRIHRSIG